MAQIVAKKLLQGFFIPKDWMIPHDARQAKAQVIVGLYGAAAPLSSSYHVL